MRQWFNTIYGQIDQVAKRILIQKYNNYIVEKEIEKSLIDMQVVESLIKPSRVMFDPLQKSMLIGFFTNRDIFLNKLIPLLSVYLDQTKACQKLLVDFQQTPANKRQESDVTRIQRTFESTFALASNIIKELHSINTNSSD